MKLRMGTRGSALALAQSGLVAADLTRLTPGLQVETVVIKTSGDRFSAAEPSEGAPPPGGAKGLFVKEIEEALLQGKIDFAVHSAKDLPAELAKGLAVGAYPHREDPRDVLIAPKGAKLAALPKGARVATASLRRQVQLKRARPDLATVPMRGNVDTRLRKLAEGRCDALLLALAGLRRLGRADVPHEIVPTDVMLPAPAQGALAIEVRAAAGEATALVARLDHAQTRLAVEFERAFLKAMSGDCATPLGVLAAPDAMGVELQVFYSEADGSKAKRMTRRCDDATRRDEFIAAYAAELRAG